MNNVIFQIDFRGSNGENYNPSLYQAEENYTVASVKEYARRIGVDFISIITPPKEIEHIERVYKKSILMKVFLFRELLRSNYDKFLFVDRDVLIKENAENIFDWGEHKYHDFCIARNNTTPNEHQRLEAGEIYNSKLVEVYNSGVFICNRSAAQAMNDVIPQEIIDGKIDSGRHIGFYNQVLFAHLIYISGIRPYPLNPIWNWVWWGRPLAEKDYVRTVHYMGDEGKQKLKDMHELRNK